MSARRTVEIPPKVAEVAACAIDAAGRLRIEQQLLRELYVQVNNVLRCLGGKWNRSANGARVHERRCCGAALPATARLRVRSNERLLRPAYDPRECRRAARVRPERVVPQLPPSGRSPDPRRDGAERYGAGTAVPDWHARLGCGGRSLP
jgi:hypothetical protein